MSFNILKTVNGSQFTVIKYLGLDLFLIDVIGRGGFITLLDVKDCEESSRDILLEIIKNAKDK